MMFDVAHRENTRTTIYSAQFVNFVLILLLEPESRLRKWNYWWEFNDERPLLEQSEFYLDSMWWSIHCFVVVNHYNSKLVMLCNWYQIVLVCLILIANKQKSRKWALICVECISVCSQQDAKQATGTQGNVN